METTSTITVNGENRAMSAGATVTDLLRELGLDPGRVAIERNLEILPRPKTATKSCNLSVAAKNTSPGLDSFQQVSHLALFGLEIRAGNF